uniref:Uncharacterized protein n=1 Tax=Rhizophora mucronata TaxID=61149 RepID=A0A2P2KS68_RHIMU
MKSTYLLKVPMVTTESGLQYKDIKVGGGPSPPVGFQVCKFLWLVYNTRRSTMSSLNVHPLWKT